MNRCWLHGSTSDALHAVLCAVGYNLRWLMRAIVRKRIPPLFLSLIAWWTQLVHAINVGAGDGDFNSPGLAR